MGSLNQEPNFKIENENTKEISKLKEVNQIVSVGSADGVLTTAALIRFIGRSADEIGLEFGQSFNVDKKIGIDKWLPNRNVVLVDLAVNDKDPEITKRFVQKIKDAGHNLMAVIDEHNSPKWLEVLGSFDNLIVQPVNQEDPNSPYHSSGSILKDALENSNLPIDDHARQLLTDADLADKMKFDTTFGSIVNSAVKSKIDDDSRRIYLAKHLAFHDQPDQQILEWIEEYKAILQNHQEIINMREDLGDGIVRVDAVGKKIDMTTLMSNLHQYGARIIFVKKEVYLRDQDKKAMQIAIGTARTDKSIDLRAVLEQNGIIPFSGYSQAVNIDPSQEDDAIRIFKDSLGKR